MVKLCLYRRHCITGFFFFRYLNDLYILDLSSQNLQWSMPRTFGHPPTARESHTAAVYNNGERSPKLIVYGGMSGCRLGDIYVLDCSKYLIELKFHLV